MTDLSIIIVCYKGWERLKKCLYSLNLFTGKNFKTEVIVVDNRSDDDTIFKIEEEFPEFRFIHSELNGGFGYGCNLGAKNALGEFLLFLNPDTVASEIEVEKLFICAKQNPDFTIVSCRQVNENGKECIVSGPFPQFYNLTGFQRAIMGRQKAKGKRQKAEGKWQKAEYDKQEAEGKRQKEDISFPDWISGSVVMIRSEMFQKLKGFDEDFWMYFEDVDLCRRVRNIGGKIALCRNIIIEHNHGGSSRINLKTASLTKTEVHISRHIYINKNKTGFERALIHIFLVINNLISGGLMGLAGLIFFFIPKVFTRTLIFIRLIRYYVGSIVRQSWIGPRSVNFLRAKTKSAQSS